MILTAFDPGKISYWARFDTATPFTIAVGAVRQVGAKTALRPCGQHLRDILKGTDGVLVEEVSARPTDGRSSIFEFGTAFGALLTAAEVLGIPTETVRPQDWKKDSRIGFRVSEMDREAQKIAARAYATQLWPEHAEIFAIKGNHGQAEACLMLRWFFLSGLARDVVLADGSPMRAPAPRSWDEVIATMEQSRPASRKPRARQAA